MSGMAELRAIMRLRPFRRLWLVLGLSSLGDWLGMLATSVFAAAQVSGTTAKGLAFGSVIAVRLLPALILGPLAGVFADRFDRRYTMVICDLLRFVMFASIPLVGLVSGGGAVAVAWVAVANFSVEAVALVWMPAKEASVPNLLPKARLEKANQLTLITTYGVTPVLAALVLSGFDKIFGGLLHMPATAWYSPTDLALYFNGLTFLAVALVVLFGIKEISGRATEPTSHPSMVKQFFEGWRYLGTTPLVRGLVFGILGAFAGGGVVIGTAQFYAQSLGGGDSTFYLMFAMLFLGLGLGVALGPPMIGALSRRRWFGMSIVLAGGAVMLLALAPHLTFALFGALLVGAGAGMAFLSGVTLLGGEVSDDTRGRVFAFVNTGTRVVLMVAITLSSVLVGIGASRHVDLAFADFDFSTTRVLLLVAGVVGIITGVTAFRQMDDKPGVPVIADLISSVRGRPLAMGEPAPAHGVFVVFEGGEGAGKSTQARMLARSLRAEHRDVVVTREPGATEVGAQIRKLVLDRDALPAGSQLSPRAEALLYAADRAHHVTTVVRPALLRGAVVISDRYVDSSLAYQGAGRTLPVEDVAWLSSWATGGLKPDLVVVLDVDPRVGLTRVGRRGAADRLESESVDFHERVRYAFSDIAAADPKRYLVVDAEGDPEQIATAVLDRLTELLPPPPERPDPPLDPFIDAAVTGTVPAAGMSGSDPQSTVDEEGDLRVKR